ncbi:WXG100 family type VII secretion target [Gordonia sp. CPCC 205515]|uniref:WXG100 family type VII secretion target n=1 Tax=Gordonia sp. CPCC 205515 TaxID=3140791 RepID=UPI003AF3B535
MSGEFTVDLDELEQLVRRLTDLHEFLDGRLEDIDRQAAHVQQSSWSGRAADAHRTAHREWLSAAKEFADGVKTMKRIGADAHAQYTGAVKANTTMFRGRG